MVLVRPMRMYSLQVVDVSVYVRFRSSWLKLQGDPRLPSREATGTRTDGTRSLINLTLTIRGLPLSVGPGMSVCFWLTQMYSLAHRTLKLCEMFVLLPVTTNTGCDTELSVSKCCIVAADWITPQVCHWLQTLSLAQIDTVWFDCMLHALMNSFYCSGCPEAGTEIKDVACNVI